MAELRDIALGVLRRLREAGHVAYFAGGCVRDELLGLRPKDFDVATDARPDEVQRLFRRTAAVGASFGVVLVREARGVAVEVATFRSDGAYSDHRRPDSVIFSTPELDAARRDFTINALFLDPLAPEEAWTPAVDGGRVRGAVIDYVDGRRDLAAGLVRAVGDPFARLAEDHLRAVRAVRFAARYGFEIEPGTCEAIRRTARELEGVSRERVGDEVRRILGHASRARGLRLIREVGLLASVFGEEAGVGSGAGRGERTLAALPPEAATEVALAAAAVDVGLPLDPQSVPRWVGAWRRRLCLSNEETARLRAALEGLIFLSPGGGWDGASVARQKRAAAAGWFSDAMLLLHAIDPPRAEGVQGRVEELRAHGPGLRPPPLVDGNDLIRLGLRPGPVFGPVLDRVYDAQLEGVISEKSGAERLALELASEVGVQESGASPGGSRGGSPAGTEGSSGSPPGPGRGA